MPESYRSVVSVIENYTFSFVLLELLLMVLCAVCFRALLRINLTLKPRLLGLIVQLKQATVASKAVDLQLQANQEAVATGLLSLGKTVPKPLRWLSKLLSFVVTAS